jgi:hypothetical protein
VIGGFGDTLLPLADGNAEALAARITDNRNYYTHFSDYVRKRGRVVDGVDLFYLGRRLFMLVRACVLRETSFDDDALAELLIRDRPAERTCPRVAPTRPRMSLGTSATRPRELGRIEPGYLRFPVARLAEATAAPARRLPVVRSESKQGIGERARSTRDAVACLWSGLEATLGAGVRGSEMPAGRHSGSAAVPALFLSYTRV